MNNAMSARLIERLKPPADPEEVKKRNLPEAKLEIPASL
jgi:hypothetical protein